MCGGNGQQEGHHGTHRCSTTDNGFHGNPASGEVDPAFTIVHLKPAALADWSLIEVCPASASQFIQV
jgi:hypothetical protein